MKRVTIKDIAKKAGVANSTVTNALNPDSKKISEDKRQEILKLVNEMGYTPMKSAQNLSTKGKKLVGLFLRHSDRFTEGVVDQKLMYYVNQFAHQYNLDFITIITPYDQEESYEEIKKTINIYNFSHVIIQGLDKDLDFLSKIVELNIPKILIELPVTNENTVFVSTNNFNAQEEMTLRIIKEKNIKNALMITGNPDSYVTVERVSGFNSAVEKAGINHDIVYGSFEYQVVDNLIKDIDFSCYDLIACGSDLIAGTVAKKCQHDEIQEITIAGFDGDNFLQFLNYDIYTIDQDVETLCQLMIEMIISDKLESKLIDYNIITNF